MEMGSNQKKKEKQKAPTSQKHLHKQFAGNGGNRKNYQWKSIWRERIMEERDGFWMQKTI